MKTTLEISDHLLRRAKAVAAQRKTTLRDLTEEGLRRVLDTLEDRPRPNIRAVTMKGKGLTPEFQGAGWTHFRDAAYNRP